jgi:hypothetical protein
MVVARGVCCCANELQPSPSVRKRSSEPTV